MTDLPLHFVEIDPTRPAHDADAPSFLLLHGFGGSSFTWHHWAPRLAERGRVVLVDLRGQGGMTEPDDSRYRPAVQLGYVRELIEQLDLRKLTLVGHSLGGGIALSAALGLADDGSDRLARLVLVATAAYKQPLPLAVTLSRYPRLVQSFIRLVGPKRVAYGVLRSIVYDPTSISDEQIIAYSAPLESAPGVRATMATARHMMPDNIDEISARYPEIDAPTLLLWGGVDRVVPIWVGRRLAEEMPRARLEVFEACGHIPPEELPEESLALVEAFLDAHPVA